MQVYASQIDVMIMCSLRYACGQVGRMMVRRCTFPSPVPYPATLNPSLDLSPEVKRANAAAKLNDSNTRKQHTLQNTMPILFTGFALQFASSS